MEVEAALAMKAAGSKAKTKGKRNKYRPALPFS
jgi:hypothetical protein